MRLIDADKLTEEWLDAENEPVYCANDVLSSIDEQPTAYDVDSLIEMFEEHADEEWTGEDVLYELRNAGVVVAKKCNK